MPSDGEQARRAAQLVARPAGPAARNGRHARTRTSARVSDGDRPAGRRRGSSPSSTSTPRHDPCPPSPRSRTCQRSSASAQRRRRRRGEERVEAASSSHTANSAVRRRSADGPVSRAPAGAEQAPEREPVERPQAQPVGAEPAHRRRRARSSARGGTTRRRAMADMLAPCVRCRLRVVVPAAAGYLLGSIPVGRSRGPPPRTSTCGRSATATRATGTPRTTLGRRAALPVFVGDVGQGRCGRGDRPRRRRPGRVVARRTSAAAAAMVGHAWPRVRPLPWRPQRGHASAARRACSSPASAAIAVGAGVAVGRRRRRRAPAGIRAGVAAFPVVQLVVDGPRRTAATGALMSLVGLRFWMAAAADSAGDVR